jgi:hypothetical protein
VKPADYLLQFLFAQVSMCVTAARTFAVENCCSTWTSDAI